MSGRRRATLRDYRERAEFRELREEIRRAGTDHFGVFGNDYTHEGGLSLQQNADEFAALCLYLKEQAPLGTYLEIGSASGGACLFLHRHLGFERVISIDDGRHVRAAEQDGNFGQIPQIERFVGDSHSPEARAFLAAGLDAPLDVAFIDGDHSFAGVREDIELVLACSRPGTLVVLHDIVACPGVRAAWRLALVTRRLEQRARFVGTSGPLGIAVTAVTGHGARRRST